MKPTLLLALLLLLAACGPANPPVATVVPATAIPTETTTVTPELVSTELVPQRLLPEAWQEWPAVPFDVSEQTLEIYLRGLEMGNDPRAYSKVGDCESTSAWFLGAFDEGPENYSLGDYAYLGEVIDQFAGSHGRTSQAAGSGFSAANVLTPIWANREFCPAYESPLDCEIRIHQPSFALVMLGTNDVYNPGSFDANMRQILDLLIEKGIVPILATKADNLEGNHTINLVIARLATEYDLPLWNFWLAVQPLPNHGLQEDGAHLTWAGSFFDDPLRMEAAWPWRNLTALQTILNVWRGVRQNP